MTGDLSFRQIKYGSYFYQMECGLRQRVLRAPLGLNLFDEDLSKEENQLHFGGFLGSIITCAVVAPENVNIGQVRQMAVHEDYQGKGYGSFFLNKLCLHLRNTGFDSLWLEARKTAIPFYEKHGFIGIGQEYTKLTIPHIRMELVLK